MLKWRPTPEDEVITALRLVGDAWAPCRFEDIRKGDVFRSVAPDGQLVHPETLEPDADAVALAEADALKNDPLGSAGRWYGYGVLISVYPSMDELKRRGLS